VFPLEKPLRTPTRCTRTPICKPLLVVTLCVVNLSLPVWSAAGRWQHHFTSILHSQAGEPQLLLGRLWPFLQHTSVSVRKASLSTVKALIGDDSDEVCKCFRIYVALPQVGGACFVPQLISFVPLPATSPTQWEMCSRSVHDIGTGALELFQFRIPREVFGKKVKWRQNDRRSFAPLTMKIFRSSAPSFSCVHALQR